jgi:hypothetical protein
VQSGGLAPPAVRLDDDLHVLIQRDKESQKAFHGKLAELSAQHFRNIGLFDTQEITSLGLFETALFDDRVNFEDELGFDQMFLGIRNPEILEYVPATCLVSLLTHDFPLFLI